ncbi:MAG: GTPase Era [Prevotellaceae bacterium]|jgi:GTP-binding protein Era|nr:GTPase Era [Prevotellaceae bacterium]
MEEAKKHKSGFANIIGNPNVGKSTLMNALVGEQLSIVTAKSQTTRHRIMGIVNGDDYQLVYSDTPGILKPDYKLQESMMKFVRTAIGDADVILYVTDAIEKGNKHEEYIKRLSILDIPVLLIINKIDLTTTEQLEQLVEQWKEWLPKAEIFPVSAKERFNLDNLFKRVLELTPEGPAYYDKETLTDRNLRFFASEIIREKVLLYYKKEIPYSAEISIEEFKEDDDMYRIASTIHVARESQKGIVIGHGGKALKWVGTEARKDMENFFAKKVFLKMFVKVNPDWRNNSRELKNFGYILE